MAQKPLTADSVNGTNVIQLTGFDVCCANNNVLPVVLVGLFTVSNGNSYVMNFDINDIGQGYPPNHPSAGNIAFDPTTGRAAVTAPDGFATNFMNAGAWYLYDQGKGFFVEEDISTVTPPPPPATSITNRALSGTITPQIGAPFQLSSISGNVVVAFGGASSPHVPDAILGMSITSPTANGVGGLGSYSALGDLTALFSDVQGTGIPPRDYGFQATGKIGFIDPQGAPAGSELAIGRGVLTLPGALLGNFFSPNTNYQASFYMIAPNQFVGIATGNLAPQSFGLVPPYTGVIFFDPW